MKLLILLSVLCASVCGKPQFAFPGKKSNKALLSLHDADSFFLDSQVLAFRAVRVMQTAKARAVDSEVR